MIFYGYKSPNGEYLCLDKIILIFVVTSSFIFPVGN